MDVWGIFKYLSAIKLAPKKTINIKNIIKVFTMSKDVFHVDVKNTIAAIIISIAPTVRIVLFFISRSDISGFLLIVLTISFSGNTG